MHITIIRQDIQNDFPEFVKTRLQELLNKKNDNALFIGIPGGRSIAGVITGISMLETSELAKLQIQLIDERVTGEKNYDTLMKAGMRQLIDSGRLQSNQFRTLTQESDGSLQKFDILFAGIGEDGHFASLFPGSYPQNVKKGAIKTAIPKTTTITITNAPKQPPKRITISYDGFRRLAAEAEIYLLFFGKAKQEALTRLIHNEPQETLPCAFLIKNFKRVTVLTDQTDHEANV
ncbi:MAG: 6-phosphogluconolactonase [Bacteroidetes bacterium]|nr:6-phosphogluconolactonase [Bacteroidota bacterium]